MLADPAQLSDEETAEPVQRKCDFGDLGALALPTAPSLLPKSGRDPRPIQKYTMEEATSSRPPAQAENEARGQSC
jgi:hypothetical protein